MIVAGRRRLVADATRRRRSGATRHRISGDRWSGVERRAFPSRARSRRHRPPTHGSAESTGARRRRSGRSRRPRGSADRERQRSRGTAGRNECGAARWLGAGRGRSRGNDSGSAAGERPGRAGTGRGPAVVAEHERRRVARSRRLGQRGPRHFGSAGRRTPDRRGRVEALPASESPPPAPAPPPPEPSAPPSASRCRVRAGRLDRELQPISSDGNARARAAGQRAAGRGRRASTRRGATAGRGVRARDARLRRSRRRLRQGAAGPAAPLSRRGAGAPLERQRGGDGSGRRARARGRRRGSTPASFAFFNEAALDAAKRATFQPATRQGVARPELGPSHLQVRSAVGRRQTPGRLGDAYPAAAA